MLLAAAATAHAGASLRLAETEARAGELVHFTLHDVDDDETYAVLIDGRVLAAGAGNDDEVSGHFTMPQLGSDEAKVSVVAEIVEVDDPDDRKSLKRKLRYLGPGAPAAAVTSPPAPPPPPPPVPGAAPAPLHSAHAPSTPSPAAQQAPARRAPRQARKRQHDADRGSHRRTTRRREHEATPREQRERPNRKAKKNRNRPRTAPLFDGVPEGSGGAGVPERGDEPSSRAGDRPTAAITNTAATRAGAGASAAVVIPALLALAGLGLAGTAVLRARRRSR